MGDPAEGARKAGRVERSGGVWGTLLCNGRAPGGLAPQGGSQRWKRAWLVTAPYATRKPRVLLCFVDEIFPGPPALRPPLELVPT